MRELKELGLLPSLEQITAFEFECYRIAEGASRTVEAEYYKELSKKTEGSEGPDKFGRQEPAGPDSAFGNW